MTGDAWQAFKVLFPTRDQKFLTQIINLSRFCKKMRTRDDYRPSDPVTERDVRWFFSLIYLRHSDHSSSSSGTESSYFYAMQEALSLEKEQLKADFAKLMQDPEKGPLLQQRLPEKEKASGPFLHALAEIEGRLKILESLLERQVKNKKILFRVRGAQKTLKLLQGDGSIERHEISSLDHYQNYEIKGLPTIKQLFVLLAQSLPRGPDDHFMKNYLGAHFVKKSAWAKLSQKCLASGNVDRTLEAVFEQETIGEALFYDEQTGGHLLDIFEAYVGSLISGEINDTLTPLEKTLYPLFHKIAIAFLHQETESLMPIIEPLFMVMRGHLMGNLEDETIPHRPACAEGLYLGLLKVIALLPEINQGHLFNVELKSCSLPPAATYGMEE